MHTLTLVGIGTGNPDHLTLQAIKALNAADLILIPRKGVDKSDLTELRRAICAAVISNPATRLVEFDLPLRDRTTPDYQHGPDYQQSVEAWHDAIAAVWAQTIAAQLGPDGAVALLVWGDPALYDSTLRIAARLIPAPKIEVIPGITAIQALTAAHGLTLNEIGAPFIVTTGRRLRAGGWHSGVDTVVVMLDGECSFQTLPPEGIRIWWAAYAGMREQILLSGDLAEAGPRIILTRTRARARHGWIMDIYLLRRT